MTRLSDMPPGHLLHLTDTRTKELYLVDTGATVSVFRATTKEKNQKTKGDQLSAANGTQIRTYGRRTQMCNFGALGDLEVRG